MSVGRPAAPTNLHSGMTRPRVRRGAAPERAVLGRQVEVAEGGLGPLVAEMLRRASAPTALSVLQLVRAAGRPCRSSCSPPPHTRPARPPAA